MFHSERCEVWQVEVEIDDLLDVVELEALQGGRVRLCEGDLGEVDAVQGELLQCCEAPDFREVQGLGRVPIGGMNGDLLQNGCSRLPLC